MTYDSQDSINKAIAAIASDNKSGAAEIVHDAAQLFCTLDKTTSEQRVIELCALLVRSQPSMAPVLNLANLIVEEVTARKAERPAGIAALVASRFASELSAASRSICNHTANLIRDGATLLTHSRSSTVASALMEAKRLGKKFSVVATEGRPAFEGRILAEELAAQSIDITLIADAGVALVIDRVALVLLGADCVTPAYASNKIGTRMIALIAANVRAPCYILCDTSKFLASEGEGLREPVRPQDEIWPNAPLGVTVLNRYFEQTPLELFAGVITEEGLIAINRVRDRAASRPLHPEVVRALGR